VDRRALFAGLDAKTVTSCNAASPAPEYFTRSTAQALKAMAIGLLFSGHFYFFCIDGEGIIRQCGEMAVMTFLVVSGMGLTKSYGFNRCGVRFIRRRLSVIFIPLWPVLAAVYLLDFTLLDQTYPWSEIMLSFAGIIKKAPPNAALWFIPFVLYLYGAFFLISYIPVSHLAKCVLLILTSFGTTVLITRVPVLSDHFGGWTTYTFAFPLSVCLMAGRRVFIDRLQLLSRRFGWALVLLWAAMAGMFVAMPVGRTLFFVAFIAISIFYLDQIRLVPRFVRFIGEHSYEIYLVHFPLLVSYGWVMGREPLVFFFTLYCVCVLLLAIALKTGSHLTARRIGVGVGQHHHARFASRFPAASSSNECVSRPVHEMRQNTAAARMPKIMHILTRLDMGGSAQNTLLNCRELAHRYETVLVHGLAGESRMSASEQAAVEQLKHSARKRGARFVPMRSLVRRIHPFWDLVALLRLWWVIRRERPDLVHTHTSKAGILGRMAAQLAGIPRVVHTPHGHVFSGHFGRFRSALFLALERWFARCTDRTVALTGGERRDYVELAIGRPGTVCTIHSGVDVGAFAEPPADPAERKRAIGLDPDRRLVGFVGWLLPVKGPQHLLNAMARVWEEHANVDLVFVGRGELEGALGAQASFSGHGDRVHFLGWREDVRAIMPLFDLFVLPSLNEGMGRVLVEAMAAGRPVVASRTGGIPDLVRHGRNGLLVTPQNELELAESISLVLGNPALADRMGDAGRVVCREFSLDAMTARLDRLYTELLAPEMPGTAPPATAPSRRPSGAPGEECSPTG
jgi:glycosyltransferase involved in cell wall biosynthesis/peptidoglycan/LPS O-acetylase OafA/YrhL